MAKSITLLNKNLVLGLTAKSIFPPPLASSQQHNLHLIKLTFQYGHELALKICNDLIEIQIEELSHVLKMVKPS